MIFNFFGLQLSKNYQFPIPTFRNHCNIKFGPLAAFSAGLTTNEEMLTMKMMHRAVNTDPLSTIRLDSHEALDKHYGLKERNIPHIKINERKDLNVWYEFGEKIGEGAFGTVVTVIEKGTRKKWALKSVTKKSGERLKLVQQEVQVLKLIDHPHIIYLDKVFESSKIMYMVFELCNKDFAGVYEERKPFNEEISKKILSELVDAVVYLHKYDIVHRDLKMENILLADNPNDPSDEYYIKLTDFGLAVLKTSSLMESLLHDFCGTLTYMAPEVVTLRSYSQTCDVWALGVILYMLVVGEYPFYSRTEKELQTLICTQDPSFENVKLSREVKDLIMLMLVKEPVHRLTATEVAQHPWFLNAKLSVSMQHNHGNILEKMKKWKSEMKVETGTTSDWATVESMVSLTRNKGTSKQPLSLPKTNISFDKYRARDKTKSSKDCHTNIRRSTHKKKN